MGELSSLQERRRQAADERLLAMLTPEQRDAVLWALRLRLGEAAQDVRGFFDGGSAAFSLPC